ncbi:MAG: hypothetical protein OXP69_15785 [Spirochaetaceae bacterium]|nr:hypothetical protein [Spirochaetaceae bacterium]
MIGQEVAERVLSFDSAAVRAYAAVVAARRSAGRPIPAADCRIAAIARAKYAAVTTKNTRLRALWVATFDPWSGDGPAP